MKEVKIKYVIAVVVAVLNLVFYGGWKLSRVSYESVSDQIIASVVDCFQNVSLTYRTQHLKNNSEK